MNPASSSQADRPAEHDEARGRRREHALVIEAESEEAVRVRLAGDPWFATVQRVESVRAWQIWLRG